MAVETGPGSPGGSRTTRRISDRRARAARRPSRSATEGGRRPSRDRAPGATRGGTSGCCRDPVRARAGDPARDRDPVDRREVQEEEIHRPARDERAGHRQGLVQGGRLEDDEPLEADAAGHRLHRVQAPGEVHVGHDRPGGLGLGGEPQGEGGLAARRVPADRQARRARDAARTQDRVERGEARPDDPLLVERWVAGGEVGAAGAREWPDPPAAGPWPARRRPRRPRRAVRRPPPGGSCPAAARPSPSASGGSPGLPSRPGRGWSSDVSR